ncbi:MAG: hypothetical protein EG822_07125 [Deltaproteobacteria bacterium]|nr:hypothetical protein [Deltaproteobacteria bacterium]TLN01981.1 MAG: hypothetical protein FDZ73_13750 [bacterium]
MFARFEQFLVTNGAIQQKQIPYYVKWVTNCYATCKVPADKILPADQKKQFLHLLENSREDWQVKQAEQALRLYTYFVSRYGQRPEPTSDEGKKWNQIIEKMIKVMRLKHLSLNTEKTYTGWSRRFQEYVNGKGPNDLCTDDIRSFLSYLAIEKKIAASTQNQALNSVLFLFRHGLGKQVDDLDAVRAGKKRRLPVVFFPEEVNQVFNYLHGTMKLMAMLTYGGGLRLTECLGLRVQDVDIQRGIVGCCFQIEKYITSCAGVIIPNIGKTTGKKTDFDRFDFYQKAIITDCYITYKHALISAKSSEKATGRPHEDGTQYFQFTPRLIQPGGQKTIGEDGNGPLRPVATNFA